MENPLDHFILHPLIPIHLFGFDLSINQAVVMMWVVVAAVSLFFWAAVSQRRLVPSKIQSLAEMSIEFLRGLVMENMGEQGMRFFPFIVTLFFFILFANLLGLIPGTYTVTSQIMVTALFAIVVYLISLVVGFMVHGLHFFSILVPPGTPGWLLPLMIPIEVVSQVARPVTLAVRLFANMTAGHTILIVLFSLMLAGGALIGWLPFAFTVAVYILEVIVAFIQAFIFTILATVYLGDAIKLH
ncbi:MAG TPA: F0F1 ATP synthase subunit A [Nitrospiria bacterium]|jgi:F-type H+-transporting ATPase subunit a|nr:F0F1 ATP synthase subunit A [Nitrospiria bacterium]